LKSNFTPSFNSAVSKETGKKTIKRRKEKRGRKGRKRKGKIKRRYQNIHQKVKTNIIQARRII
tara:strand:- start:45 stop:233 length:189 start_codon:yes stop_codon:yes gene_type:complete